MKRIMSIIIMVALVLGQSTLAMARGYDPTDVVTSGPFTASTSATGTGVKNLYAELMDVGTATEATTLGWAGVTAGTTNWKVSGQYVKVGYTADEPSWGVQIYTDNMGTAANPKYSGKPLEVNTEQPAGLIGVTNDALACPMAILVTDDALATTAVETPVTTSTADLPTTDPEYAAIGTPGYKVWFTSGYDKDTSVAGSEKSWFWLKDKKGTAWVDADNDGILDTGELVESFTNGEDYATIVEARGLSTGWVSGAMSRDFDLGSKDLAWDSTNTNLIAGTDLYSLNIYIAADFTNAREAQVYTTNTLTLELYHE